MLELLPTTFVENKSSNDNFKRNNTQMSIKKKKKMRSRLHKAMKEKENKEN